MGSRGIAAGERELNARQFAYVIAVNQLMNDRPDLFPLHIHFKPKPCRGAEETVQVVFHENGPFVDDPEKIKNAVAALNGKITDVQSCMLGINKFPVEKCCHLFTRLYFFKMAITLSTGNASTVRPPRPFTVVAANNELMMASSVASMAAMNKGDTSSLRSNFTV